MGNNDRLRAAAKARATNGQPAGPEQGPEGPSAVSPAAPPPPLGMDMMPPDTEELPEADPESVPVAVAWARVMREVRAITKEDRFESKNAGNFNFRGVDRVVNAFGRATRKHGVLVLPHRTRPVYTERRSSSGTAMRECTLTVEWRIYGPQGDYLEAESSGEASDSAGRSTSKATSVAERILLLVAGLVPTGQEDPEAREVDRGEVVVPTPGEYLAEITNPNTVRERFRMIWGELRNHRLLDERVVTSPDAPPETLEAVYRREGARRGFFGEPTQAQPAAPPAAPLGMHRPAPDEAGSKCTLPGCGRYVDDEEVHIP